MLTRDQALVITSALVLLPNARLSFKDDWNHQQAWVIEWSPDKDNLYNTYVGYSLAGLADSLSKGEWGGWKP